MAPVILCSAILSGQERSVPSERITLGVIVIGIQRFNDMCGSLSDLCVQVVAVCHVNKESPGYSNGKVAGRKPRPQVGRGPLR